MINNHTNNIKSINSDLSNIENDIDAINSNNYTPVSNSKYSIENIFLFNITFIKDLTFLSDTEELLVYQNIIKDEFKKDNIIEINKSFLYKYDNIKNVYYILKERFEFLNENDNILDTFYFNALSKGFIYYNFHIFKNSYYYKIRNDVSNIKFRVYLERINKNNNSIIDMQLTDEYQSNFICFKYLNTIIVYNV